MQIKPDDFCEQAGQAEVNHTKGEKKKTFVLAE